MSDEVNEKFPNGVCELVCAFNVVVFGYEFIGNVAGEALDNDLQNSFVGKRKSV